MPASTGMRLYVGIMSGTSLDAVDAVLIRVDDAGSIEALAGHSVDLPVELRARLLELNSPAHDELHRAALASLDLAALYADAVQKLLAASNTPASEVAAIGVHGQTVRHRPDLGYTLQLNAPARVAEFTGIDVIADFRSRDMAAGGQGAPLVPAFHAAQFSSANTRVVLNLGGIANITILDADGTIRGCDTGPANMLMDAWTQRHLGRPYDADGAWALSGTTVPALLECFLDDPWFALPPPKSTGRDDFSLTWLDACVERFSAQHGVPAHADVQATLLKLTVETAAAVIRRYAPDTADVLICGGGGKNAALLSAFRSALPWPVTLTDEHGLPGQWVEAAAFAWLAWCHERRRPAGLPAVTGAGRPTVLGCRYVA